jgi:hypothetical protein
MKRLILSLILGTTLALSLSSAPALALFEGAKDQACQGINLTDQVQSNGCSNKSTSNDIALSSTLRTAINGFSLVVGVIAVIMIIVGGLKYITSSGDSSNVNSAKNTLLYALIGLAIVALAQVIVRFVLNKVNGT